MFRHGCEQGLAKFGKVARGRGRKATIPQAVIDRIVELTQNSTPVGETHWSTRTMAEKVGVSKDTVQRVWSARGLKPHLVKTFKLSTDPTFEEKLIDVVRFVPEPPREGDRVVRGRKVLRVGSGPHPAVIADGQGQRGNHDS